MRRFILPLITLGLLLACRVLAASAEEANIGAMGDIVIEESGGYTGGVGSVPGRMPWSALSEEDRRRVDALFAARKPVNTNLHYRLTRDGANGPETIDAAPGDVPEALIATLKPRRLP
jgi:hypothetical protein